MGARPDVSVLIPTYNRRTYLQQAIESCFAGNEDIEVEIIVVDDGSTDGTRDYLEALDDPRVQVLYQDQQGPQAARNRGMAAVRGRYFKQLDDDDYLVPGGLDVQVRELDRTGCSACYGEPYVRYEETNQQECRSLADHDDTVVAVSSGGVPTWNLLFLLNTDIARKCTWNEELDHLHILSYLLEFCRYDSRCAKVEGPVAVHRIHEGPRVSQWADEVAVEREREFEMYRSFLEQVDVNSQQERALVRAMWMQAHIIAPHDWARADQKIGEITQRWPDFRPPRSTQVLSMLDRILGAYNAERLLNPLRALAEKY
jgi:glycosyltransferase involved in cell wall biosynthesis